ncbi:MAG: metalloregulator ArsR/SmtB family transcription factor [archaeon]
MAKAKNEATNKKVIRFFSTIADPTRLCILLSLMKGKKTVNEIYNAVGKEKMTLSAISHQLKQLEQVDVVTFEKKGREKTVTLSEDFCWCILRDAYNHFDGKKCACEECAKIKK